MGAVSQTNQKSKAKELTPEGESLGRRFAPCLPPDSLSAQDLSVYLQRELYASFRAIGAARWVAPTLRSGRMQTHNSTDETTVDTFCVTGVTGASHPQVRRLYRRIRGSNASIRGVSQVSRVISKLSRVRMCAHTLTCAHNRSRISRDTCDPLSESLKNRQENWLFEGSDVTGTVTPSRDTRDTGSELNE